MLVAILGSREWVSKNSADGKKDMATLSLLSLEDKKFMQPTVSVNLLQESGVTGLDLNEVYEMELEDDGMRKRVVGFKPSDKSWKIEVE